MVDDRRGGGRRKLGDDDAEKSGVQGWQGQRDLATGLVKVSAPPRIQHLHPNHLHQRVRSPRHESNVSAHGFRVTALLRR